MKRSVFLVFLIAVYADSAKIPETNSPTKPVGKCFKKIDLKRMKCVDPYTLKDDQDQPILNEATHLEEIALISKDECCCENLGAGWQQDAAGKSCELCPIWLDRRGQLTQGFIDMCYNFDVNPYA